MSKNKKKENKVSRFLDHLVDTVRKNYLLIAIFVGAALLRTWSLGSHAVFFDDASFDMWSGVKAVETRSLPLLGIASSVPRFHQGPLTVWIHMLIYILFGKSLIFYSIVFVLIALLALVLVYELCARFLNGRVAMVVSVLVAFSPFAVAQARMPYHTNPIPLFLVLFLWMVMRLWQKKKHSLFWAVLAWCLVFQFELNLLPLLALIPYVLWRTNELKSLLKISSWKQILLGGVIGLWPQIIYDLGHKFSQLGLFFVWIVYRVVTAFVGKHQVGTHNFVGLGQSLWKYIGRIWTVDSFLIKLVFLILVIASLNLIWKKLRKKKLKPLIEVTALGTLLLTLSYLVHGGPSEAYFPPFIILLPILVGWGLVEIFKKKELWLGVFLGAWAIFNVWSIFNANFFVSNDGNFGYSYGVDEQRQVMNFIYQNSGGDFQLDTTRELRKFKSAFTNLEWHLFEAGQTVGFCKGNVFYIEDKNSSLKDDPRFQKKSFTSVDVYFRPSFFKNSVEKP